MDWDAAQSSSAACTGKQRNMYDPTSVNVEGTDDPVRVAAPWMTSAIRSLSSPLYPGRCRGPVITQGSQTTWEKLLRWTPRLPRSSSRSPFTQTSRNYHPLSQLMVRVGPLHRTELVPLSWPMCSPIPPPPKLPYQWPLGSGKTIQTMKINGRSCHYIKTYRQPWQWCHVDDQFWREQRRLRLCWVAQKLTFEIVQHAINRGTHPLTQADTRGCQSWYWGVLPINGDLHQDRGGTPLWIFPTARPPRTKTTEKMALCLRMSPNHPHWNHPWQTPQSLQNLIRYALESMTAPPPS